MDLLGTENFYVETIAKASTITELENLERHYIKLYSSIDFGYNTRQGGGYSSYPEEVCYEGKWYRSYRELGEAFNTSYHVAKSRLEKGLSLSFTKYPPEKVEINNVVYVNLKEAAKKLKIPYKILCYRKQKGYDLLTGVAENTVAAKFTPELIKKIKKYLEEGLPQRKIALKLGISQGAVSKVNRGITLNPKNHKIKVA